LFVHLSRRKTISGIEREACYSSLREAVNNGAAREDGGLAIAAI
jgi:hypothetical protein